MAQMDLDREDEQTTHLRTSVISRMILVNDLTVASMPMDRKRAARTMKHNRYAVCLHAKN
jgi:hypothetical protein